MGGGVLASLPFMPGKWLFERDLAEERVVGGEVLSR